MKTAWISKSLCRIWNETSNLFSKGSGRLQSAMSLQRISTKKSSPFSWKLPPEGTSISYSVEGLWTKRIKSSKCNIDIILHKKLIWDFIYLSLIQQKCLFSFKKKSFTEKRPPFFNYQNLLQITKYIHYDCDFVLNSCSLNCLDLSKTLGWWMCGFYYSFKKPIS